MEKKKSGKINLDKNEMAKNEMAPDGYPAYPVSEDIYNTSKQEEDIDPENLLKKKQPNKQDKSAPENEKDFAEDKSGNDLDVPGAELDDEEEAIGSEDEENNYYSLGGDDHNDLDEDRE